MASCIYSNLSDWLISIPRTHNSQGVIYYEIAIKIGTIPWSVNRRYSEFARLNDALIKEQGINKDLLPPKKYIGNLKPDFLNQRKAQLELYLNSVFHYLVKTMPPSLAAFLQLEDHDVMFIIRNIPKQLALTGGSECSQLSVLQVHSMSTRLKLPCPPAEMLGYQHDFCSILEACNKVVALQIDGSGLDRSTIDYPTKMDFFVFKSLRRLALKSVPSYLIDNADALRSKLSQMSWVNSELASIECALLCDSVHKHQFDVRVWSLEEADFTNNLLTSISEAASLMPDLVGLVLSDNRINSLLGLNSLKKLEKLKLQNNGITCFRSLQLDPSLSLTWINLSNNQLSSLEGLELHRNLRYLDISNNLVSEFNKLLLVCLLPQLTALVVLGNPISSIYDYRVKVLELFENKASYISLDHVLPDQKELDKVAVLQALRIVKEGRSPL